MNKMSNHTSNSNDQQIHTLFNENSQNSLFNILDDPDITDEEQIVFNHSKYYNTNGLTALLRDKQDIFKILSLNCQSLRPKINQIRL